MEGLSAEREALWARIHAKVHAKHGSAMTLRHDDKVSFLALDEKRAAVGYGPAPREEIEPRLEPAFGGEVVSFVGAGDLRRKNARHTSD